MANLEEMRAAARDFHQRSDLAALPEATIQNSDDLPTNKVRVYRPDIRQSQVVNGVVRTEGLTVWLKLMPDQEWQIFATAVAPSTPTFGAAVGTASQPPVIGKLSSTVWDARNLSMGLVRAWYEGGFGLNVYVDEFTYKDRVISGHLPVTVPGTTDERQQTVIFYDYDNNTLALVNGTASTMPAPLFNRETAAAISIGAGDRLRLGAVLLDNGQTDVLDDTTRFYDLRDWLTPSNTGTGLTNPLTSDLDAAGFEIQNYTEETLTTSQSTSYSADWETASLFEITLTGNVTLTFSNLSAGRSITIILEQDGTGGRTITFPGSIEWVGGSVPTLTPAVGAVDVYTFMVRADGSTVFGFVAGQDMQ